MEAPWQGAAPRAPKIARLTTILALYEHCTHTTKLSCLPSHKARPSSSGARPDGIGAEAVAACLATDTLPATRRRCACMPWPRRSPCATNIGFTCVHDNCLGVEYSRAERSTLRSTACALRRGSLARTRARRLPTAAVLTICGGRAAKGAARDLTVGCLELHRHTSYSHGYSSGTANQMILRTQPNESTWQPLTSMSHPRQPHRMLQPGNTTFTKPNCNQRQRGLCRNVFYHCTYPPSRARNQ